ncbi:hypothetical protein D3C76_1232920 [compost metagenome]
MPVARRLDLAARQVDGRDLDLGERFAQLATGNGGVDLGIFAQLGADRLGPQGGTTRGFVFTQAQLLLAGFGHGIGLVQGRFEAVAIDRHEQLAGLDLLVVVHLQLTHPAGHVRSNDHHVGANLRITGPGREHVVLPEFPSGKNGHHHQAQGYCDTYSSTHGHTPYNGPSTWVTRVKIHTKSAQSNNASCQTQRPNGV